MILCNGQFSLILTFDLEMTLGYSKVISRSKGQNQGTMTITQNHPNKTTFD